jgi:hypothetical protein
MTKLGNHRQPLSIGPTSVSGVGVVHARRAHDRILRRAVTARWHCSLTCLIDASTPASGVTGAASG